MLKDRRSRLTPFFQAAGADALLVTNLKNIRYLCGFTGSEGVLLLTPEQGWFLCDSRYTTQAAREVQGVAVREFSVKYEALCTLITEEKFQRVACEGDHLTVTDFVQLSKRIAPCALTTFEGTLHTIRSCKDAEEIDLLQQVATLASTALATILPLIRPGIRECDLARELEFEMRRSGADSIGFEFIVASGERGALPHGVASSKLLQAGELVTIDFGAVAKGYHSDETVTVALGTPDPEMAAIHRIVKQAHDLAIEAVKPGISCRELDAIARQHIASAGYGEYFGHGLGHGVGLDIHEKPTLSPRSNAVVEQGNVITIEPGIYLPGRGGVRIEDTVAVTATGCTILTSMPKDLICL